ncbi:hypothetical protein Tco_0797136 [Tanacetum coccineum]
MALSKDGTALLLRLLETMLSASKLPLSFWLKQLQTTDMLHLRTDSIIILVPQGQKASDYDNSDPVPPRQNVVPTAEKTDSSQQGL